MGFLPRLGFTLLQLTAGSIWAEVVWFPSLPNTTAVKADILQDILRTFQLIVKHGKAPVSFAQPPDTPIPHPTRKLGVQNGIWVSLGIGTSSHQQLRTSQKPTLCQLEASSYRAVLGFGKNVRISKYLYVSVQ